MGAGQKSMSGRALIYGRWVLREVLALGAVSVIAWIWIAVPLVRSDFPYSWDMVLNTAWMIAITCAPTILLLALSALVLERKGIIAGIGVCLLAHAVFVWRLYPLFRLDRASDAQIGITIMYFWAAATMWAILALIAAWIVALRVVPDHPNRGRA